MPDRPFGIVPSRADTHVSLSKLWQTELISPRLPHSDTYQCVDSRPKKPQLGVPPQFHAVVILAFGLYDALQ